MSLFGNQPRTGVNSAAVSPSLSFPTLPPPPGATNMPAPNPQPYTPSLFGTPPQSSRLFKGLFTGAPLPSNDPYQAIQNMQGRLNLAGVPVPQQERFEDKNLLFKFLDVIDRPRNAVVTGLKHAVDDKPDTLGNIVDAGVRGWKGQERTEFKDLLPEANTKFGKAARWMGGFIGDVVLDPTNYLSLGTAAIGKSIGKEAAEATLKEAVEAGIKSTATSKGLSAVLDDIAQYTGKNPFAKKMRMTGDDFLPTLDNLGARKGIVDAQLRKVDVMNRRLQGRVLPGYGKDLRKLTLDERIDFVRELGSVGNRVDDMPPNAVSDLITNLFPDASDEFLSQARFLATTGKVTPAQLEAALIAEKHLGKTVASIDVLTQAGKIKLNRLDDFGRELIAQADVAKQAADVMAEIKYVNGLSELVDGAGRVKHIKFFGKPLMEFSSKVAPAGKAFNLLYDKVPKVAKAVDTVGGLFQPEYIRRSAAASPEEYRQLQHAAREVTRYLRKETGAPYEALYQATKAYDKELLESDVLRRATTYYLERNKGSHALAKWMEFASMPEVQQHMDIIERAAKTHEYMMDALARMDDTLSIKYTQGNEYLAHYYKGNQDKVALAYQLTKGERVAYATSLDARHAYSQKLPSLARAAAEHGLEPIDDIVAITALRSLQTQRVGLNKALMDALQGIPGDIVTKQGRKADQLGRQAINIKKFKAREGVGLAAHPEVIRQMNRLDSLFINDESMNQLLRYWDGVTNFMKTMQTSANPAFLARNVVGETLLNFLANVTPASHGKAVDVMNAVRNQRIFKIGNEIMNNGKTFARQSGALVEILDDAGNIVETVLGKVDDVARDRLIAGGAKAVEINGKQMLPYEVMKQFRDVGLGWSGVTKGDLVDNMTDLVKEEIRTKKRKLGYALPWVAGKEVGDFTETWTRLAHMIDRLDQGWDIGAAALDVRKFHVDYRHLTPTEAHGLRRVMPFYTYMRHNTPIQLRLLLERPGYFGALGRLVNQSQQALGLEDSQIPEYLRRGLAVPLFRDNEGNVRYLNWNLPLIDAGRITMDLQDFGKENFLDMLHPGLKAPFEMLQDEGRNVSLGTPIEKFEGAQTHLIPSARKGQGYGGMVSSKWVDYPLQQLGFVNQVRNLAGYALDRATNNQMPLDERIMRPPQIPLAGSFLPVKSPRYTSDSNAYRYRDELQDYIKRMEQAGALIPAANDYQGILQKGAGYSMFGGAAPPKPNVNRPKEEGGFKGIFGVW